MRTLWEIHFPPFEAAVRAGAGSIMAAFNEIGGTPAHASEWLLGDVLRERWGCRGLVVGDWTGVEELLKHGIAARPAEAAAPGSPTASPRSSRPGSSASSTDTPWRTCSSATTAGPWRASMS